MRSSDVARTLGILDSTVRNVSAAFKKYGSSSERPKTGRPRTVNTRRIRGVIKRKIDRNDGLSLNKVAGELKIGGRTVQRILKDDLKIMIRISQKSEFSSEKIISLSDELGGALDDGGGVACGQYLSDASKANRLDKAKQIVAHFRMRRVSDVIWSDEKIFTIEPLPNRQNQRQLLCVTSTGKTPLVFIDRNVKINAEVYQKTVLMDNLSPWASQHFVGRRFILQQDWAPSHGAKSKKVFLGTHFHGYLGKDLWPARGRSYNSVDAFKVAI
uniref:Tc1-like transposase DDE domain-containing protein n=1 Tax=Caenorhabditis japonica TaxID=281687 RepID=A0A8R1EFV5_CAEJA